MMTSSYRTAPMYELSMASGRHQQYRLTKEASSGETMKCETAGSVVERRTALQPAPKTAPNKFRGEKASEPRG